MRAGVAITVALAGSLAGCTTIEIHGSNRVDVVRQTGLVWSLNVQGSEPVLVDRTSFGFDASLSDFIVGFRRSRSVYRPVSSHCPVLIVVDNRSDAEEAIDMLARSLRSTDGSVCVLRN